MNLYKADISGLEPLVSRGFIALGQEGRGRKYVLVPVLPGDGEHFRAGNTPKGVVVARSQDFPGYFLVVADANGGYSRGSGYKVRPVNEYPLPEVLAAGIGAWGDAGGIGVYQVALLRMQPGQAFCLRTKYGDERLFVADESGIHTYTKEEWDAAHALKAVEEGDIQWL